MTANANSEALRNADRATRERSQLVFDRPLVVEAGAGTGKTSLLVGRIVAWALGEGWERAATRLSGAPGESPSSAQSRGRICPPRRIVGHTVWLAWCSSGASRRATPSPMSKSPSPSRASTTASRVGGPWMERRARIRMRAAT